MEVIDHSLSEVLKSFFYLLKDLLHRFAGGAARRGYQMLTLIGIHKTRGVEKVGLIFFVDDQETMFIRVNKLAGLHFSVEYFDLTIPAHRPGMGMADA